jgi:hypothetical protein
MQTCGQCAHGKLLKDNLQQRVCKGAPPQLVLIPGPGGSVQMIPAFPNVGVNDEACGAFKPREFITVTQQTLESANNAA